MIALKRMAEVLPVCPTCKQELAEIWFRDLEGDWGKRRVYFCPHCRACLGFSHRKGPMFGL